MADTVQVNVGLGVVFFGVSYEALGVFDQGVKGIGLHCCEPLLCVGFSLYERLPDFVCAFVVSQDTKAFCYESVTGVFEELVLFLSFCDFCQIKVHIVGA